MKNAFGILNMPIQKNIYLYKKRLFQNEDK